MGYDAACGWSEGRARLAAGLRHTSRRESAGGSPTLDRTGVRTNLFGQKNERSMAQHASAGARLCATVGARLLWAAAAQDCGGSRESVVRRFGGVTRFIHRSLSPRAKGAI